MKYNGDEWRYLVYLPSDYDSEKKYPLVLNFHGILMNTNQQMIYSQMNVVAEHEKFIVVYPQGRARIWNTGIGSFCYKGGRDDVGFVNALLDSLINHYSIATDSVYAAGMSLGGYFSYRLACELGHRLAAIASVTGVMSDSTFKYREACNSIPVLQIHGTDDWIVKYRGSKKSKSVEETIKFWVKKNQCFTVDTIVIPDSCKKDRSCSVLIRYDSCLTSDPVWFVKIHNGGHTWPGTPVNYIFTGRINYDFHASVAIWDFFRRFSRDQTVGRRKELLNDTIR